MSGPVQLLRGSCFRDRFEQVVKRVNCFGARCPPFPGGNWRWNGIEDRGPSSAQPQLNQDIVSVPAEDRVFHEVAKQALAVKVIGCRSTPDGLEVVDEATDLAELRVGEVLFRGLPAGVALLASFLQLLQSAVPFRFQCFRDQPLVGVDGMMPAPGEASPTVS